MLLLVSCGSRRTSAEFASSLAFKMHLRLNGVSQWRHPAGQIVSGEPSRHIWSRAPSRRGLSCSMPLLSSGQKQITVVRQSRFVGVHGYGYAGKWAASIRHPASKLKLHLGVFEDERKAALACDAAEIVLRGAGSQRNFPGRSPSTKELREAKLRLKPKLQTSRYKGVRRAGSKWHAQITVDGQERWLGSFHTELEAAQHADCALRGSSAPRSRQLALLNFVQLSDYFDEGSWQDDPIPAGKTSRFLGVSCVNSTKTKSFKAVTRRRYVGSFRSELEAAKAFDAASAAMGGRTNFAPHGLAASWPEAASESCAA